MSSLQQIPGLTKSLIEVGFFDDEALSRASNHGAAVRYRPDARSGAKPGTGAPFTRFLPIITMVPSGPDIAGEADIPQPVERADRPYWIRSSLHGQVQAILQIVEVLMIPRATEDAAVRRLWAGWLKKAGFRADVVVIAAGPVAMMLIHEAALRI